MSVTSDCVVIGKNDYDEIQERIRMLSDIALSALALKLRIEHKFAPDLTVLNRDLTAFNRRFGRVNLERSTRQSNKRLQT